MDQVGQLSHAFTVRGPFDCQNGIVGTASWLNAHIAKNFMV